MVLASKIKSNNISLFTIGLGKDVNKDFLIKMASDPGDAYFAPTSKELTFEFIKALVLRSVKGEPPGLKSLRG